MSLPLAGVRVVEIGQEIQGPFAGLLLGDLGADVIKIENRTTGDLSRWALAGRGSTDVPNHDVSPYFIAMNRGKRSITLDLKRTEAIEVVKRLAARADVVLTNYRPGVLDRLGIGFEGLKEANPKIVFTPRRSCSNAATTGPR
ncbi:MAG: CoA transferase [Dehalococcoidia bacterium]